MNTDRFKFRVWNKLINAYDDDGFLLDVRKGRVAGQNTDIYTLEQCTGLRDKNGKLVFEADVVSMYIHCEDAHRKCVVEYCIDCDTAQWICRYLDGSRKHRFFGKPFDITTEYLDGSLCEIIGNIHEMEKRK